jgi:Tfp pilus assembly protein PilF
MDGSPGFHSAGGSFVPPDPSRSLETARALDASGAHAEAAEAYRAFLDDHPDSVEGLVEYGGLLLHLDRLEDAGAASDRALRLAPSNYGALLHAASVKMLQGNLAGSEAQFREALALEPTRIAGPLMFSDCLLRKGDLDGAGELLRRVLQQVPDHAIALDRLGTLMVLRKDWPGLRRDLQRQQARYSGPEAEYVGSHADLMFGDMPRGWQRFEARLDIPGRPGSQRAFPQPRWQGLDFPGQTLLLTWEQGYGDTLMFLRFATLAKARGGRVIVEVQPALAEIAATCAGIDEVVAHGHPLPPFDLHASLMSLPALLGTRLDTIPCEVPYLRVPPLVPDRQAIHRALEPAGDRVRIGICWAGSPDHPRDAKRSLPPALLAPLGAIPHVAWHSFQFGAVDAPPLPGIVDFGDLLKGFPNTACALAEMDLVITVDTVLAHLAGALGVPSFLLLSFIPDWRWMMDREDTPWYPTMRLYRQRSPGNWPSAIELMIQDLCAAE